MATASRAYLDATRPLIETTVGRPLRLAEQIVDVFALTRALDDAKDKIHQAIEVEKAHVIGTALRTGHPIRLHVTRAMLAPLEQLYRLGRTEALAELQRARYPVGRRLADDETSRVPELGDLEARLGSGLNGLAVRVETGRTSLDLGGASQQALANALLKVPGGRSIAAGLVSTALFTGMGATFEEHADLVGCWEYTSVLDGGTCEVCEPLDGTEYHTLDDLFVDLPNFGPNPNCLGGDRCRCRAVPCGADNATADLPAVVGLGQVLDVTQGTNEVAVGVRSALAIAADVHRVSAEMPVAPVRVTARLPGYVPGRYTGSALTGRIEISAHADDPGFTALHELGHYIDHHGIGPSTSFASTTDPRLEQWRAAINASNAVRVMRNWQERPPVLETRSGGRWRPSPDELTGYYLTDQELFARSYSQWIASRSGDPQLLAELNASRATLLYPEQWEDDDFVSIAAAFETLMEELGWQI